MADNPKEELLKLLDAIYRRGIADSDRYRGRVIGYSDLKVQAVERMDQIETGGIVRAAIACCDGCHEGKAPTISASAKVWVHTRYEPFKGGMRAAEEIRCNAQDVWTYLALRAKQRELAKGGG